MGNRKKEQEAFEQMFKSKKTNPFLAAPGKSGNPGLSSKGTQAKGNAVRSTRATNRGV